jgi:hypothetical protein
VVVEETGEDVIRPPPEEEKSAEQESGRESMVNTSDTMATELQLTTWLEA